MAVAQQFYFSLEPGVDKNVGRMVLFHLIASCILRFYSNFPKVWYKIRNSSFLNLNFATLLEFGAFEVTLMCKTLKIHVQAGAGVLPSWISNGKAHGTAAFLRGLCIFSFHLFLYPIKETNFLLLLFNPQKAFAIEQTPEDIMQRGCFLFLGYS